MTLRFEVAYVHLCHPRRVRGEVQAQWSLDNVAAPRIPVRVRVRVADPGLRGGCGLSTRYRHGLGLWRIILASLLIASRRLPRLQQPRVLTRQSEPRRRLWSCARITPRRGSGMRRGARNRGARNRRLARLQARGIIARREHLRAHGPAAAQDPPVGGGAHRTDRPGPRGRGVCGPTSAQRFRRGVGVLRRNGRLALRPGLTQEPARAFSATIPN